MSKKVSTITKLFSSTNHIALKSLIKWKINVCTVLNQHEAKAEQRRFQIYLKLMQWWRVLRSK